MSAPADAEERRLLEDRRREAYWRRWGPYLPERQWGTVREDYSPDGSAWDAFPHDHARSRTYRFGEDGLLGLCDRRCRLCFSTALWNGRDEILKERLFGLTNGEGNHGEDVKEIYFYLDATPTSSYLKALYRYPQAAFPYRELVEGNTRRSLDDPELDLEDTGVFAGGRYTDVQVEYAKAAPDDVLIRLTLSNRGPEAATLHVLPTLWFRNTWSWGREGEDYAPKPRIRAKGADALRSEHATLGVVDLAFEGAGARLFTENESNEARLWGRPQKGPAKDAFHEAVVHGRREALARSQEGTKAAFHTELALAPGESRTLRLRLREEGAAAGPAFGDGFDAVFAERLAEADAFYAGRLPDGEEPARVARQAYAGLLWTRQFYFYDLRAWQEGDPTGPPPPPERSAVRNADWTHVYNRDVLSVPDKWEYPWFAAWDLAFHMVPMARVDPGFARDQLLLLLREWYLHPNGQLPAYEYAFGDTNPPVHAWAAWQVYRSSARAEDDRRFLARIFHKLLLNFTWWVNRKDPSGNNLFGGGFLGLDNIGVFDRSKPLPTGGRLEQADATAWMGFYCASMLTIALELARHDAAYEDIASKFFEHFVAIAYASHRVGGCGLWDEEDGFYYDVLALDEDRVPLRVRSLVGLVPLFAQAVIEDELLERLPAFARRMRWLLDHRPELHGHVAWLCRDRDDCRHLIALTSEQRLRRVLRFLLDEEEFLSPYGVRSLSRAHAREPFVFEHGGGRHEVAYQPAESDSPMFGGNSNWRGPIWLPMNHLIVGALDGFHDFYGEGFRVPCPTGGAEGSLADAAREIATRVSRLFLPDADGRRAWQGREPLWTGDPHWRDLLLFHEYFHGDDGRGLGASHQTGWTALVCQFLERAAR